MPQLHFSIDERTAQELTDQAAARGETLSKYLATLVRAAVPERWPEGYLESVVGSCAGAPLEEPSELPVDEIEL